MKYVVQKRVWVDMSTHDELSVLFGIGRGFISREEILSAIIYEWINSGGATKIDNIMYVDIDKRNGRIVAEDILKRHFIYFSITDDLWDNFKDTCSNTGINVNVGFKIAVNNFADLVIKDSIDMLNYILDMRHML